MKTARAFNAIESMISVTLVGVALVASLGTVAASRFGLSKTADRGRGAMLAHQLMAEILAQNYADPDLVSVTLGPEIGETLSPDRSRFDDVDDYSGWSASPPQDKDGSVMSELAGWRHSAAVAWVNPADLTQTRLTETGVKRITVTVSVDGVTVAELVAIRAEARDRIISRGL